MTEENSIGTVMTVDKSDARPKSTRIAFNKLFPEPIEIPEAKSRLATIENDIESIKRQLAQERNPEAHDYETFTEWRTRASRALEIKQKHKILLRIWLAESLGHVLLKDLVGLIKAYIQQADIETSPPEAKLISECETFIEAQSEQEH